MTLRGLAILQRRYGSTASVYAPGSYSGGTAGSVTQVGTAVPGLLVPSANNEASGLLGAAPAGLGGGRADYLWIDSGTATIRPGYELRAGGGTYFCIGTADWRVGRVCALSQPS
jgi:hypothetical protein